MRSLPDELMCQPFTRERAAELGVTARMLTGKRFVRVFPRVWRVATLPMSRESWIAAARLALPIDARLTGITRIQALGLDHGPRFPLRFVVARDHHIDIDEIFLHRTVRLPPCDELATSPAAAFLAYCSVARTLDAIKVGDWLIHHGHMTSDEVRSLALRDLWRAGADEALWVLPYLNGRSRSLAESELRVFLVFAGLVCPEVNVPVELAPGVIVMGDLWFRAYQLFVEYEGTQHQEDRNQYVRDIDRYAHMRRFGQAYVQITKELSRSPRSAVERVHGALVDNGYDGPDPRFDRLWPLLFTSLHDAVGERTHRRAS